MDDRFLPGMGYKVDLEKKIIFGVWDSEIISIISLASLKGVELCGTQISGLDIIEAYEEKSQRLVKDIDEAMQPIIIQLQEYIEAYKDTVESYWADVEEHYEEKTKSK